MLIQFSPGPIYAWPVFTKPLVETGWTQAETEAVFALVRVLAGRIMPKLGPRKLAMSGSILLGLGYFLASVLNPTNFWVLVVCIGLIF